jgi:hypothetical protein
MVEFTIGRIYRISVFFNLPGPSLFAVRRLNNGETESGQGFTSLMILPAMAANQLNAFGTLMLLACIHLLTHNTFDPLVCFGA